MNRSLNYARAHPDEVRGVLSTYTKIPPAAIPHIALPNWTSDPFTKLIQRTAQLAQHYGFMSKAPEFKTLYLGLGTKTEKKYIAKAQAKAEHKPKRKHK